MSDIADFLTTTGRTLSQMALYSPDHPTVKDAISESHRLLSIILSNEKELALSSNDGKLLFNGQSPENVSEAALRPFIQLLEKFTLHSLSFTSGITHAEMIPFFRLASRSEFRKGENNIASFLTAQNVTHIEVNQARYAKIGEDEEVGMEGKGAGAGEGDGSFWKNVDELPLNDLLKKLIDRSGAAPADQMRIFSHALELVKKEIEVTVQKVTEEFGREKTRLTNERERTEGIVGTVAEGVVVVDEAGHVLMMNPAAEQIYGVTLGECIGKPLWEGVREEQMVTLAKDLTVPTDRPVVKEVQILASAETQKTIRASTATIQDPNGRIVGLVSVLSDVTKQKELTRLQNEFMANVTHELRAPLHALKLAVDAILEGSAGKTTPEQEKMLVLADRNADRLARLIDDLLDFSKIEAGSMEIKPQVIDLAPYLLEATASLDAWSKSRGVKLVCEEVRNLPPVFADADRILQVVINLLSNGIKFTPAGGQVTLRAKKEQAGDKTVVRVEAEDTGKGISKEDQKRIFERFVQLKQDEKVDVRGTGLGLSICQALVGLHKGTLSVESPPPGKNRGSLFYFTIPAVQGGSAPKAVPVEPALPKPAAPGFWKRFFSRMKAPLLLLVLFAGVAEARPYWGHVRRVKEGNLIQLEDGSMIRLLGVGTPKIGEAYFQEALSGCKRWVENQEVHLRYGLQERTPDGAWLAYVYADGVFVNEELVREGLALVEPLSNDEDDVPDLLQAEREAGDHKRGLWSTLQIEDYSTRYQKKMGLPWASGEEQKRGVKENP